MPWKECTMDTERKEFVSQGVKPGANKSQLCRDFGISRTTGYKWLARYQEGGIAALQDRSRRPNRSPRRTSAKMETRVMMVREAHPSWGGRKIRAFLLRKGEKRVPAPSTITEIIRRHHGIDPQEAEKHRAFQRFEMAAPNMLWQMDFKGDYATMDGQRCYPLTVLDDHSRYLLGLRACINQKGDTVQEQLIDIFRQYGLPQRMLVDNGPPWSGGCFRCYTGLSAWLLRLDITVSFSRPRHPQTLGKDERLHRTLNSELIQRSQWATLAACQPDYDQWRQMYNKQRPHEALQMAVPADRYHPSPSRFPEQLPPVTYDSGQMLRKVDISGKISLLGSPIYIGKAFKGEYVAIEETDTDGVFDVYFCKQWIHKADIRVVMF
jgi:transposase InsO family protein